MKSHSGSAPTAEEAAQYRALNTPHTVTISAPLLRPGITISASCSERYVAEVTERLINIARTINENAPTPKRPPVR